MKRRDTFMLALSAFILTNCASYFVVSELPYLTGWGPRPGWCGDFGEGVGFPFVLFRAEKANLSFSMVNGLADLAVALIVSWMFARFFSSRLPPLWVEHRRAMRVDLQEIFFLLTSACLLLGVSMAGSGYGLPARNIACFLAPPAVYAWYIYRRRLGWTRLATASVGLFGAALLIELRYSDFYFTSVLLRESILGCVRAGTAHDAVLQIERALLASGLTLIRAAVPIFGLVSLLVVANVVYDSIRLTFLVRLNLANETAIGETPASLALGEVARCPAEMGP